MVAVAQLATGVPLLLFGGAYDIIVSWLFFVVAIVAGVLGAADNILDVVRI